MTTRKPVRNVRGVPGHLFTPYAPKSARRLVWYVSAADYQKIRRGGPWTATVVNLVTGRKYRVRGAECAAGPHCFCDAEVVKEISAGEN